MAFPLLYAYVLHEYLAGQAHITSLSLYRHPKSQAKEAEGAENAVMLLTHLTTFIMGLQDERVRYYFIQAVVALDSLLVNNNLVTRRRNKPDPTACLTCVHAVESRGEATACAAADGLRWREEVDASGTITTPQPRHIFGESQGSLPLPYFPG